MINIKKINESLKNAFGNIKFDEESHTYYKPSGEKFPISSTKWLKQFTEPFDRMGIATRKSKKEGIPVEEILKQWDKSAVKGTLTHLFLEFAMQDEEMPKEEHNELKNEYPMLLKSAELFHEECGLRFLPVQCELVLGDEDLDLAGMVDLLAYDTENDELVMIDYKTSKSISTFPFNKKQMLYPFNKYGDANFYHYSLQMSLYNYIIEKNTGYSVSKKYIIHLSDLKTKFWYKIIECVDMENEVDFYFNSIA